MNIKDTMPIEEWERRFNKRKEIQDKVIEKSILQEEPFFEDKEDIKIFEKELFGLGDNIDILEWGPGISTRYYSNLLHKNKIKFNWEAIEYDIRWYVKLINMNLKNVRFHLFDQEILRVDDRRALRGFDMNEYVKFPSYLGKKYDLIFIDGTKRVRCMQESLSLLKPNGVVMVHDAQRKEYEDGYKLYNGKFLSRMLWKGVKKSQ